MSDLTPRLATPRRFVLLRLHLLAATLVLLLVATACSVQPDLGPGAPTANEGAAGAASTENSNQSDVTAGSRLGPTGLLEARPCSLYGTANDGETCATFVAPEIHGADDGDRVALAVTAYRDDLADLDPLTGIGELGKIGEAILIIDGDYRERLYDDTRADQLPGGDQLVVAMAPRGTAESRPDIGCNSYDRLLSTLVEECFERLERSGVDATHYEAADIAADAHLLRLTIGIDRWHVIVAGSFDGSQHELVHALERVDPSGVASLTLRGPDLGQGSIDQMLDGTAELLDVAARRCQDDTACRERFPLVAENVRDLLTNPVAGHTIFRSPATQLGTTDGRAATSDETLLVLGRGLADRDAFGLIPLIAEQAAQGKAGMLQQLEWSASRDWTPPSLAAACGRAPVAKQPRGSLCPILARWQPARLTRRAGRARSVSCAHRVRRPRPSLPDEYS